MSNPLITAEHPSAVELLQIFIKETPTAIAMFDRDMNYIATSQRWCDDFKLDKGTLEGRNHYEIFPEIPEHWREVPRRCLDGASEEHAGELFERADGTRQWIAWKVKPWSRTDSGFQVDGLIMFSEDLTSLYEAHKQEMVMKKELDVAEALHQELEKTNRAKDIFLANLSHELRNPLNAISGWVQIMKRGALTDEKTRDALFVIEQNVWQLHALIVDTLDINRIDSDKFEVRLHEIPLDTILTTAISNITPKAIEKNITLSVLSLPTSISVLADQRRIEQALSNILSNAIKFTPPHGSVSLGVQCNDQGIELIITDTGEGIPSTMLTTIFDRYVQVEPPKKSHHQSGLGLGLTIAKHIIELHGGTIEATSLGIGRGSTFTIKLPQKRK
jgi:PAS domain S-box-containing protein